MIKIELAGAFLLPAVALVAFGAPAGAMTVVNSFPKGVNEK